MIDDRCWNCKRDSKKVRSKSTGKVYCLACGASHDGCGAVTDLSLIETEPYAPGDEHGTDQDV